MSAASFQYSFDLTLSVPDNNLVIQKRVRLSRVITEPIDRLYTKIIAFCHSYHPDLEFNTGGGDPLEPALARRDLTADYITWIDIGCPSYKKLSKPVRSHYAPDVRLYFFRDGHKNEFYTEFREWGAEYLSRISCHQIDPAFLEQLSAQDQRTSEWSVTLLEGAIYLDANGISYDSLIQKIDLIELMANRGGVSPS